MHLNLHLSALFLLSGREVMFNLILETGERYLDTFLKVFQVGMTPAGVHFGNIACTLKKPR